MSEKIKQLKIKLADGYSKGIPFEGGSSDGISDVQVNGTSVVTGGVANVPLANHDGGVGVTSYNPYYGTYTYNRNTTGVYPADSAKCKAGEQQWQPIAPSKQHESTFYGLAKVAGYDEKNSALPVGQYTEEAKSAISDMLNGAVTVSGTTPTITALSGVRYVCGEVSTLDITVPASGIIDVVFTSGSTATVLTVTPPTGMTMKWANSFDPTSLDANTTYEINIMDGVYGAVMAWI